jgi:hypothetical protein
MGLEEVAATVARRLEEAGLGVTARGGPGERYLGTDDRWWLIFLERGGTVRLRWRTRGSGAWRDEPAGGLGDLEALWPDLLEDVRWWAGRLTVFRLVPGRRYRVVAEIEDFYGNRFLPGEVLTFEGRDFLPYEDGHTLRFVERKMWLQGGSQPYEDFGLLVEEIDPR